MRVPLGTSFKGGDRRLNTSVVGDIVGIYAGDDAMREKYLLYFSAYITPDAPVGRAVSFDRDGNAKVVDPRSVCE